MSRCIAAAAGALAVALVLAASASASYDPIGSGTAKLTLDPSFAKLLARNGIELLGRKGAKVKGPVATLAAAGGKADPTIKKAEIELDGELILATPSKRVPLTKIELKTKPTPIFARVGGGQLKLAKAAKVSLERDGFGNELVATKLKLTAKTATRFNKRLHTEAFAEGQKLGTLTSTVQPQTVAVLPAAATTIVFDSAIYAKLKALSTSVNPIFPAEHVGPTYTFPIAIEGQIAPDAASGTLRSAGNLEFLRLGFGQIFWNELWIDLAARTVSAELDLEPVPKFPGKLGRLALLALTPSATSAEPTARTVSLQGALTLQPETATYFNQAFAEGKDEFHPGELLGTLSFTAQTQ